MFSVDALSTPVSSQPLGRFIQPKDVADITQIGSHNPCQMFVEIIEQPVSDGARFRYKCEGRSAGCIRGVNSTEKQKTYPTIKVQGYRGAAGVVVSCVTKDGPPYYPHPHNLVGKTCSNGVCYKPINNADMICSFSNLGIQCVKKKDIKDSLAQREALQVDPFGTGFSHFSEPGKINLNSLRLCFQVFIPDSNGKLCVPLPPVISTPIFDNKTVSDLTIRKLSHFSAPVTGGQEVILLCDQVNKDDIQIVFYEDINQEITWTALGKFSPHDVHRKAAISFQTPPYKSTNIQQQVHCYIQLRRPSDGTVGKPRAFTFLPLTKDPEGMARKRNKFEALRLDTVLRLENLPTESEDVNAHPRIIKQAVRSKTIFQKSANNSTNPLYSDNTYHQTASTSAMPGNMVFSKNTLPQSKVPNSFSRPLQPNCQQNVDDLLAVATQQIGLSEPQNYCDTPVEDTLDKLSSLDLGLNSGDLADINLSGITLDSFTESTGLNFSLSLGYGKSNDV